MNTNLRDTNAIDASILGLQRLKAADISFHKAVRMVLADPKNILNRQAIINQFELLENIAGVRLRRGIR